MINWIKSKFRKHCYIHIRTSSTGGAEYKCLDCKRKLYIPLWSSYEIDVKNIKGCRGR